MCIRRPSLDNQNASLPQSQPAKPVAFKKGSLLARLEQGESVDSIKANMPFKPAARKKTQRKLKNWFGLKGAVELPAEDIPRKIELPGDVFVQKKALELDSQARVELPTNPSKEAQRKEDSAGWRSFTESRGEKAKRRKETECRELASRSELDGTEKVLVAEFPGDTYRPFRGELDRADGTTSTQSQDPPYCAVPVLSAPLTAQLSGNTLPQVQDSAKSKSAANVSVEIIQMELFEKADLQQQLGDHHDDPGQSLEVKEQELRWLENVEQQIQARKSQLLAVIAEP